jgi:hypothetical protein
MRLYARIPIIEDGVPGVALAEDEATGAGAGAGAGAGVVTLDCVVFVSLGVPSSSASMVSSRASTPATAWEMREPHRDLFPDAMTCSRLGYGPV